MRQGLLIVVLRVSRSVRGAGRGRAWELQNGVARPRVADRALKFLGAGTENVTKIEKRRIMKNHYSCIDMWTSHFRSGGARGAAGRAPGASGGAGRASTRRARQTPAHKGTGATRLRDRDTDCAMSTTVSETISETVRFRVPIRAVRSRGGPVRDLAQHRQLRVLRQRVPRRDQLVLVLEDLPAVAEGRAA
jgi:hypothetical protein